MCHLVIFQETPVRLCLLEITGKLQADTLTMWLPTQNANENNTHRYSNRKGSLSGPHT